MRKPYLVQRGTLKQNVNEFIGIDDLVAFDYMGAAEFEFNALPVALKEFCENLHNIKIFKTEIRVGNKNLFIFCKHEDFWFLNEFWWAAIANKYAVKTKELLYYDNFGEKINFWWDIGSGQNWMAVFSNKFEAGYVLEALKSTKKRRGW